LDRQRIEEMMRYAESGQCRKQIWRAYFSEPEGERCGLCDNCLRPAAVPSATVAGLQEVTEIQTAIGPVITTAPETLPSTSATAFHPAERVRHPRFGEGEVVDAIGDSCWCDAAEEQTAGFSGGM
jgi:ATP-dependent DNA helicase RecQ